MASSIFKGNGTPSRSFNAHRPEDGMGRCRRVHPPMGS
jgi:hypothetical protein